MTPMFRILILALVLLGLAACQKAEEKQEAAAPVVLTAPTGTDDMAWRKYLTDVVMQNMGGITNSPFMYYLPAESAADFEAVYNRQLENVSTTIARTVLPGNMLAFGSPASTRMADLIETSFQEASTGSMEGVRVLYIGKAEDSERVKAAVEPSGAEYVFFEAK